jgi:hypothetical protein
MAWGWIVECRSSHMILWSHGVQDEDPMVSVSWLEYTISLSRVLDEVVPWLETTAVMAVMESVLES